MIDTKRLATDAAYWRECGAPEDATHVGNRWGEQPERGFKPCWYKKSEGFSFMYPECRKWEPCADGAPSHEPVIPRPQSEWVDGLPPVGVECEINPHGEWFKATVHGYGKNKFLAEISSGQTDSDGDAIDGEHAYWTIQTAFRPLRTPEQRQRDELINAATKVIGSDSVLTERDAAEALYDAGMLRKGSK